MAANQTPAPKRVKSFLRDSMLWISILILLASIIFFWIAPFAGIYWLREAYLVIGSSFLNLWRPLGLCLTALTIGGVLIFLIRYLIVKAENCKVRITISALTILTVFITLVGLFVGILIFLYDGPDHLSSATLMDDRFHLEIWRGSDYIYYDLFKCNFFDFACENIWDISLQEELGLGNIYLVADPDTNRLLIVDDGETIYTYPPPIKSPPRLGLSFELAGQF